MFSGEIFMIFIHLKYLNFAPNEGISQRKTGFLGNLYKMKILVLSATEFEIPFYSTLKASLSDTNAQITLLITGVGILESSYTLMRYLRNNTPDYIVQFGIAGSFDTAIPLSSVVLVVKDRVADTIVMEVNGYKTLEELGFQSLNASPYSNGWLENPLFLKQSASWIPTRFQWVAGVTVNEISTDPLKMDYFRNRYKATVESMEGATMHYIALCESIPFLQIRAISNHAGDRNKENWHIKTAITALQDASLEILRAVIKNATN